ncbi:unnamed protein product [Bursaphelenchus okinawaensis]|uniref:PHD-type domain-containing protein n=1 Tax=Bursaphelenchus okinawaensis TaxID=465554 RepID=A0A811K346_9BILA|nr:unnamed protein product [Bursaphelenchus okinawaensis]CAG9091165.1 unnamed protein product [Bursaphelenchus okinawaensis]
MDTPSASNKSNLTFFNTLESSEDESLGGGEDIVKIPDLPCELPKYKKILGTAKTVLEKDAVFVRTREELYSEMDELVRRFQSDRDLSPESLFRMYESMEDSIDNCIDLNSAHLSVLRYHALELAKFAPLEVLDADEDIPIEEQENEEVEISDNTPHVPVKKVKKVEDAKVNKKKRKEDALSSVSTRNSSQNSKTDNGYQEPKKKVALKRTEETPVRRVAEPKTTKKPEKKEKQPEVAVKEEEEEKMDIDDNSDAESKEDMIETRRNTRRTPADKAVDKVKKVVTRLKKSGTPDSERPKKKADSVVSTTTTRQSAQRRAKLQNEANPDEQTYCLCDQISYGQMIGCDNLHCSIEWFHFECVDIKAKPAKGVKWYCPLCRGDKSSVLKPGLKR